MRVDTGVETTVAEAVYVRMERTPSVAVTDWTPPVQKVTGTPTT